MIMLRNLPLLLLLLGLLTSSNWSVEATKTSNLRAEDRNNHPDEERRRIEEIASYWTAERIRDAKPWHGGHGNNSNIHGDDNKQPERRRLHVVNENREHVPFHLESEEDRYLLWMTKRQNQQDDEYDDEDDEDENISLPSFFVQCSIQHETLKDHSPHPRTTVAFASRQVDLVVQADEKDDEGLATQEQGLTLMLQYRRSSITMMEEKEEEDEEYYHITTVAHFDHHRHTWGPGQYTFRLGPLPDGEYRWTVMVESSSSSPQQLGDSLWEHFTIQMTNDDPSGDDDSAAVVVVPTMMRNLAVGMDTCSNIGKPRKCRKRRGCIYINNQCVSNPPRETTTTTTTTTAPPPPGPASGTDACSNIGKPRKCRKNPNCKYVNKQCVSSTYNPPPETTTTPAPGAIPASAFEACGNIGKPSKCRKNPNCKLVNKQCVPLAYDPPLETSTTATTTTTTTTSPPDAISASDFDACGRIGIPKKCRKNPKCKHVDKQCVPLAYDPPPETPSPTPRATTAPTTPGPTRKPTAKPTPEPTSEPTLQPTPEPTTVAPTPAPTPRLPPDNPNFPVDYISPKPGITSVGSVTFKWRIGASKQPKDVLLAIEFPDGSVGYVDRKDTDDGRDEVAVNLEEEGRYRWAIWGEYKKDKFEQGPWRPFQLKSACSVSLARYTKRDQDLHKAVGRIIFIDEKTGVGWYCSGTLVDGANDRVIIATAAHCIYHDKSFPKRVIFIPGQDDNGKDKSDFSCANDPHGCFYPKFGVISDEYRAVSDGPSQFQYDYGFYVAPDTDSGNNNGPDKASYAGNSYKSLVPMSISFDGIQEGENTYLFGYPLVDDPYLMYTQGLAETAPSYITSGGWLVSCSRLSSSASGGPWTHSNPATGKITVRAITTWGWTDGRPGMGASPYDTGGAECVYNAANAANLNSGYVVANCPK